MDEDQKVMEEMQQEMEEMKDEEQQDQFENNLDFQEGYGPPEQEERRNSHTFLHRAVFDEEDTIKLTNLDYEELGRPLFNVRFLLDMEDIAKFYLDEEILDMNIKEKERLEKEKSKDENELDKEQLIIVNKIADYFKQKIKNITDSGMSKDGFTAGLNVTKRVDTTRKRVRENSMDNLKGKGRKST